MNKEKIKEMLLKPDKAKALALAVAFVVTNPLMLTGCAEKYPYQDEEQEEQSVQQNTTSTGGGGTFIHYSTSTSKNSGTSWSKPSSSKSGYSSLRGGSSSS